MIGALSVAVGAWAGVVAVIIGQRATVTARLLLSADKLHPLSARQPTLEAAAEATQAVIPRDSPLAAAWADRQQGEGVQRPE